ncbi:hypothetical protein D3260_07385 [Salinisphaera sp. Q1T1-3]|nr:hypothetical protein D3260_07385 [Salinisphaera sp. Q1T1-3]
MIRVALFGRPIIGMLETPWRIEPARRAVRRGTCSLAGVDADRRRGDNRRSLRLGAATLHCR